MVNMFSSFPLAQQFCESMIKFNQIKLFDQKIKNKLNFWENFKITKIWENSIKNLILNKN